MNVRVPISIVKYLSGIEGIIKPCTGGRIHICPSLEQRLTYGETIDVIRHARIVVRCALMLVKIL